jgi:DNA-binding transcriptional LysR family regulator
LGPGLVGLLTAGWVRTDEGATDPAFAQIGDAMDRVLGMTIFVKVVDSGGFAAAARALNMSASTVTVNVQAIEDRLGVRLLNRTTRHVSMTEAGHAYYDSCTRILADIDSAEQAAQELQSKPRGTLRLNAAPMIPALITPVILEFTAQYPDVSLDMTLSTRMVELVEEGFDLALRIVPTADSSLIIRRLAGFRFTVCGAPDYLARRGTPTKLADLAAHNCLIFSDSPFGKEWRFLTADGTEQGVPLSGNFRANSGGALRSAALAGQGLMHAPRFLVADDLAAGRLIPVLTEFRTAELGINAIYPHRRHLSAKVRIFIDLVTRHFRETGAAWTD